MRTFTLAAAMCCAIGLTLFAASPVLAESEQQSADHNRMMAAAKVVQSSIDTARKGDFDGWLRHFATDVTFIVNENVILGRAELRQVYEAFYGAVQGVGLELREPEILDSGWTGERVYIWQKEYLGEAEIVTYGEYEVRGGKIVTVVASY